MPTNRDEELEGTDIQDAEPIDPKVDPGIDQDQDLEDEDEDDMLPMGAAHAPADEGLKGDDEEDLEDEDDDDVVEPV